MNDSKISKKKIALFVGKLGGGGAERAVSRLSFALNEHYDICVFLYNNSCRNYSAKGEVIDIGNESKYFIVNAISACLKINYYIRKNDISLVFSFLDVPNMINGIVNHSCKKVVSLRAYYEKNHFFTKMDRFKFPIIKKAFKKADTVVTLSIKQKNILHRDMNIEFDKICVVDNLFDINRIIDDSNKKVDVSIKKIFNNETTIAIGRLNFQKNYKQMLKVFSIVLQEHPNARLIILGEGEQKQELVRMSNYMKIDKSVFFMGRVDNPYAYLKKAKLYISLSNFEGFPNSLVEAMTCGLPVMHTDCMTGPAEILRKEYSDTLVENVEYEEYGILLPLIDDSKVANINENIIKKREKNIAHVWGEMLTNPELQKRYSKKSLLRAEMFDANKVISEYVDIIDKMVYKE